MKRVSTTDLVPGMVTYEDVYNYSNQMILPKDTVLTDKMITRLEFYSILSIRIKEDGEKIPVSEDSTYSEKIKSTEEFKEFEENFFENVDSLESEMNDIVSKNTPINPTEMLKKTTDLIPNTVTTFHVFDMLHNMRQYDDFTYTHSVNVALICNVFGRWLRFSQKDIETLTLCGLLHDKGKLIIPDEVITKSDVLTDEEFKLVKKHAFEGYRVLKGRDLDESVSNSALMHHERCDGTGYPLGLTGPRIKDFAKIVAIADVYDAMTSKRVYRGPLCPFKVIEIFIEEGLQKYEAKYILTFLNQITNTYIHNRVRLTNGQEGDIVLINQLDIARPIVKCGNEFVNLAERRELHVEAIL